MAVFAECSGEDNTFAGQVPCLHLDPAQRRRLSLLRLRVAGELRNLADSGKCHLEREGTCQSSDTNQSVGSCIEVAWNPLIEQFLSSLILRDSRSCSKPSGRDTACADGLP